MASSSTKNVSELSPEVSLRLFKDGGTFVFLNVPSGTEVGIDMQSWNTGDKFQGIKMIPPGLHFIYFSAVSKDHTNIAPRTGFFHVFGKGEIYVRRYDQKLEDLEVADVESETTDKIKDNLEHLDQHLGPYPYDHWRKWISLTNRITDEALQRLSPPSGRILSAPELTLDKDQTRVPVARGRKPTKLEEAEDALPRMSENYESRIRYSQLPAENYPEGSTPREITKYQLDKTWKLQKIIDSIGGPQNYLAEIQYAFVNFLVGQNYTSFEHWKSMVQIICHSDDAILKYPGIYSDFISDLYFQIAHVPEDFFSDIVTCNNFLFNCLQRLFNNVKDHGRVETKLKNKAERFSEFLSAKYGWDFSNQYDDEPVIVDEEDARVSTI